MLHGIAAPELYRSDGKWKWNNYQGRYHDMHVDLMDMLSGYGASRWVGLGKMCDLLQIPSKELPHETHLRAHPGWGAGAGRRVLQARCAGHSAGVSGVAGS